MHRLVLFCGVVLLFAPLADAQALHHYADAENGVSFDYSADWRPQDPVKDVHYLLPSIQPVRAAFVLDVNPMPYAGSDFASLAFNYAIAPAKTPAACAASIAMYGDTSALPAAVINGRRFASSEGGDAAMMHQIYERLYSTFANDRCYVFDLALSTAGFGAAADDEMRQMSQADRDDAQKRLDSIFGTVRIAELRR